MSLIKQNFSMLKFTLALGRVYKYVSCRFYLLVNIFASQIGWQRANVHQINKKKWRLFSMGGASCLHTASGSSRVSTLRICSRFACARSSTRVCRFASSSSSSSASLSFSRCADDRRRCFCIILLVARARARACHTFCL